MGLFYAVCVPNLGYDWLQVTMGAVLAISAGATMYLGFQATYIDPKSENVNPDTGDHAFCGICQTNVETGSLHCRECNKCKIKRDDSFRPL